MIFQERGEEIADRLRDACANNTTTTATQRVKRGVRREVSKYAPAQTQRQLKRKEESVLATLASELAPLRRFWSSLSNEMCESDFQAQDEGACWNGVQVVS